MRRQCFARLLPLVVAALLTMQSRAAKPITAAEKQNKPVKILLDTDPGGDDAFALLWLQSLARQGLADIVAVTTVGGNVRREYTFANACRILALGGFQNVEVGRSAAGPGQAGDAAYIHGQDGMGDLSQTLPPPRHAISEARSAEDILIEKLSRSPGQITLVAIGPLTNLAAAEKKRPGILAKAKEVVLMGGAFRATGNVSPHAEFNIHFDPEAAETVLASRNDIVLLPLDVTRRITFTTERAEQLLHASPKSPVAQFAHSLCRFLSKTSMSYRATEGVRGFHVHDAATLAYLFYPETLLLRRAAVRVETKGQWTRGQTVMDDRHGPKTGANAWVALQVDATNLLAVLTEDLKTLAQSP